MDNDRPQARAAGGTRRQSPPPTGRARRTGRAIARDPRSLAAGRAFRRAAKPDLPASEPDVSLLDRAGAAADRNPARAQDGRRRPAGQPRKRISARLHRRRDLVVRHDLLDLPRDAHLRRAEWPRPRSACWCCSVLPSARRGECSDCCWRFLPTACMRQKALFLAPFLWVPLEIVRGFPFDFPWDPLGTVLVNNIPLARIATATGVYGLSFEIVLVNTAFAAAFLVAPKRRRLVLLAAIVVAGMLQAGELVQPPRLAADRTARLVQGNIPILDAERWTPQYFQSTLRELSDMSVPRPGELAPTEPAPDLVVWPESPAPFFVNNRTIPRRRQRRGAARQRDPGGRQPGPADTATALAALQLGRRHRAQRRMDCALRQDPPRALRRVRSLPSAC